MIRIFDGSQHAFHKDIRATASIRKPAASVLFSHGCFITVYLLAINYDEKNRLPEIISNFDLTCGGRDIVLLFIDVFNRHTGFLLNI